MKMFHRWCHGGGVFSPFGDINKPGDGSTEQVSAGHGGNTSVTEERMRHLRITNELARRRRNSFKAIKTFRKGLPQVWRHTTQVLANQSLTASAWLICYWLLGE